MVIDLAISFGLFSLLFCLGWAFVHYWFLKGDAAVSLVKGLFSATFALSCFVFAMMMFEIGNILDKEYHTLLISSLPSTRRILWNLSLGSIIAAEIFVIPLALVYLALSNITQRLPSCPMSSRP